MNLLDLILDGPPPGSDALTRALASHVAELTASRGRGDRHLVARAEALVEADPVAALPFDARGHAHLTVEGRTYAAGRFETPTVASLRERAVERIAGPGRARLFALAGAGPAADVGGLQATSGRDALFQVASQFNALESPDPFIASVASYLTDPTQGPRAAISAFPGALARHYRAPSPRGGHFVQRTDGPQIDLLATAFGQRAARNGYFTGEGLGSPAALAERLAAQEDHVRVGLHDELDVVLGHDWDGGVAADAPRIAQALTSTVAAGGYGGEALGAHLEDVCRPLLRAAYRGTLFGAVALGRTRVVLTLIGGGVFGNPVPTIWSAILSAFDEVAELGATLDVVVNGHRWGRGFDVEREVGPRVLARDGALIRV